MQLLSNKIDNGGATSQGQIASAEWNQPTRELENLIGSAGIGLDGGDLFQSTKAISYYSSIGDFFNETGSVNAYVASTPVPRISPDSLTVGMKIRIKPGSTNTTDSTLNAFGTGALSVRMKGGINQTPPGAIVADTETLFEYDGTFWILVQTLEKYDGNSIVPHERIATMANDADLQIGNIVQTRGYTTENDGGATTYLIVAAATGTHDAGSFIDLIGSGHQAKALFGLEYNLVQFGNIANSSKTEVSPFSSVNNITQINRAFAYAMATKNVSVFVPAGVFRYENVDYTDSVTIHGLNLGIRIYGAGPNASILFNSGGGTSSPKTCLMVGRNSDVHSALGVVGATLAEYDSGDFSNLNTSDVFVHSIGFQMELGTEASGNQGFWGTNCRDVHVREVGNYGCSTPVSWGNDLAESVMSCSVFGIYQFRNGRWFDLFIGHSQNVNFGNIINTKNNSPELESVTVVTSRNCTGSQICIDGQTSTVASGNRPISTLYRSENITLTGISARNVGGVGIALFEPFSLATPGTPAIGPSYHNIEMTLDGPIMNDVVTIFTEQNNVRVNFDPSQIATRDLTTPITLGQTGKGTGISCAAVDGVFDPSDIEKRLTSLPGFGTGVAIITGFTNANNVTIEIVKNFPNINMGISEWQVIDGAINMKTDSNDNDISGSRKQLQTKWIREGGSPRTNLYSYGVFKKEGDMEIVKRIIARIESDAASIGWQIDTMFDSSPLFMAGSGGIIRTQTDNLSMILDGGVAAESFYFVQDGLADFGRSANRADDIYAINNVIQTSDENEKTTIESISDQILDAWEQTSFGQFQWLGSVESKGQDSARIHFGMGAQSVLKVFQQNNIDPSRFGFYCYNEWKDEYDQGGALVQKAGHRYGLRYSQCFILEAATQRRINLRTKTTIENLLQRIEALENAN